MDLITVKTFDNPMDAHIAKTKLEDMEIICCLFDENMVGMNPMFSQMAGGIKLNVLQQDAEKALTILQEMENLPVLSDDGKIVKCPRCESTELYTGYRSMRSIGAVLAWLFSIMFYVFPIYQKQVYRCKKCGKEFKAKKTNTSA